MSRAPGSPAAVYEAALASESDIHDHLATFVAETLRRERPVVVELGSRAGVSTAAWLYGVELTDGRLWTVDLGPPPALASSERWTHVEGDDLDPEVLTILPDEIDLCLIDTSHAYYATLAELRAYVPRMRDGGVMFCHDTDNEFPHLMDPETPEQPMRFPVRAALDAFCHDDRPDLTWTNTAGSWGLGRIDL